MSNKENQAQNSLLIQEIQLLVSIFSPVSAGLRSTQLSAPSSFIRSTATFLALLVLSLSRFAHSSLLYLDTKSCMPMNTGAGSPLLSFL